MVDKNKFNIKKLPRSFNVSSLKDAIIEQKFLGNIETQLVISRFRNGKETFSICTVKEIHDSGLINTWDETLQQWFGFTVVDSPRIVKIYN